MNYIRINQNIPLRGDRRRQTIIPTTTISRITRTATTATMVAVENLEGDSGSFSSEINKQGDQYLKHSTPLYFGCHYDFHSLHFIPILQAHLSDV